MFRIAAIYVAVGIGLLAVVTGGPLVMKAIAANLQAPGPAPEAVAASDTPPIVVQEAPASSSSFTPAEIAATDGGGTAAALAAAVAAAQAPEPVVADSDRAQPLVRGGKASLEQTTAAILAQLAIVKDSGTAEEAEMLAMSSQALSGLKGIKGQAAPGEGVKTLESLVSTALKEGQSDAAIDAIVNEAAIAGEVSVPSVLVTSEGKVDTAVLLANLVTQAQIAAGVEIVKPQDVVAGGEGVEVHQLSKADGSSVEAQFYTVGAGDSLGAIAVKFYGNVAHYPKIYEANRAILSSPDRLRVGQRLVIPKVEA